MAGMLEAGTPQSGPPEPARREAGIVGETASELARLTRAWTLLEAADHTGGRIVAFESLETFAALITRERRRILRHLHDHPESCVTALADALDRPFPLVHEDVMVLEMAGLIERPEGRLEVTADRFSVMMAL